MSRPPGRRAATAAGLVGLGLLLFLVLATLWSLAVVGTGALFASGLYHFDLLSVGSWQDAVALYRTGGVIPFGFGALLFGMGAVQLLGLAFLLRRISDLSARLARGTVPASLAAWMSALAAELAARRRRKTAPGPVRPGPGPAPPPVPAGSGMKMEQALPAAMAEIHDQQQGIGDDLAAIGRAMALYEVWSDPAPGWLAKALGEELARITDSGWPLLADFGPPAAGLLSLALREELLPADPKLKERALALLSTLPHAGGVAPLPPSGPGLTMSAGWLLSLLDDYRMLEEIRLTRPEEFAARWSTDRQDTIRRIGEAMAAMSEADWASVDLEPERAAGARALSDSLREELSGRQPPAAPQADFGEEPPPDLSVESERLDGLRLVLSRLEGLGFATHPLPPGQRDGQGLDLIARRGQETLVLRLQPLLGRRWLVDGDGLAPWRCDGEDLRLDPSPLQLLWRRAAVQRARRKDGLALKSLLVLFDGMIDTGGDLGALVELARRRTGIEMVDGPGSALLAASLADHLERLA